MSKNGGGAGSSRCSPEGGPDSWIRPTIILSPITKGSAVLMTVLLQDVDAIQSMIRQPSRQLTDVAAQLRVMVDGIKRIQEDRMANRVEG